MRKTHFYLVILFSISLLSCDKEVGTTGVLVDAATGVRIQGVSVIMSSEQGSIHDKTIENGFFNAQKSFSCGLSNCETSYFIQFVHPGYETRSINEDYFKTAEATYVNESTKDTLIVKLKNL